MNDFRQQFAAALKSNESIFGIELNLKHIDRLADYYELVRAHNEILHLVAPCSPEEFATRHVFESLTMLEFLPPKAKFADIGAGAGLPSIPCLIVREDLRGVLIESKPKKADFLREVLAKCELEKCAEVLNDQFEEAAKLNISYVSCRALDKFIQKLPRLLKWSGSCGLLFFGGNSLREELKKNGIQFNEKLMPLSERRYLFVSRK